MRVLLTVGRSLFILPYQSLFGKKKKFSPKNVTDYLTSFFTKSTHFLSVGINLKLLFDI